METQIKAFTGSEEQLEDSKYIAVHEFYKAFNTRNKELMKQNWSQSETIRMMNPIGGVRKGWTEISLGYDKIFSSDHQIYIEFYDFQFLAGSQMFVVNGRERGHLKSGEHHLDLHIRTSRVYQLEGVVWKQVHHHGSMDDPKLLEKYQNILLKK